MISDSEEEPLSNSTRGTIERRSFDLLTCPQYYEVGERIENFIGELIRMMQEGQSEQVFFLARNIISHSSTSRHMCKALSLIFDLQLSDLERTNELYEYMLHISLMNNNR